MHRGYCHSPNMEGAKYAYIDANAVLRSWTLSANSGGSYDPGIGYNRLTRYTANIHIHVMVYHNT